MDRAVDSAMLQLVGGCDYYCAAPFHSHSPQWKDGWTPPFYPANWDKPTKDITADY